MLMRHGSVIAEHWWKPFAPDKPHMLFSLSKSYTSTAIGLAVDEGLLSEDDTVISFFPEYITPAIEDNLRDVRIRHLLSMSTGHVEDTMPYLHRAEDGDWVRAFLSVPIEREPGTHFLYNTGATYMLSAILQRVSGETLLDYLKPRLFDPLGISNPTWQVCPRGVNTGGFGLSIRTEDIAKFGELYLRKGVWGDLQLVPSDWIDTATRSHISNGDGGASDWAQGYGYQFWRCRHNAYRGDGAFGQFCVVMPEQDAVLAITSGLQNMQGVLNIVWDTLLPAMSGSGRGESAEVEDRGSSGGASMLYRVSDAIRGPEGIETGVRTVPDWAGQWYRFDENPFSLTRAKLDFAEDGFHFSLVFDQMEWTFRGAYLEWLGGQRGQRTPQELVQEVAVQGGWRDSSTFVCAICFSESPFTYTFEVSSADGGISLSIQPNVGFEPKQEARLHGRLVAT